MWIDDNQLKALMYHVKTAYLDASTRPENCADAKMLLKGVKDRLKPCYDLILELEKQELTQHSDNVKFCKSD